MLGFFEAELQKVFGKGSCIRDIRFTGRACVGRLGETTNVKVQFVTMGMSECYEGVKATVFNRNEGVIDASTFRLSDIWGTSARDISYGKAPSIRTYNGKAEWYFCQPSAADYRAVAAAVNSYLEVFLDPPEKTRVAENTGGERADGYTSVKGIIEESKKQPRQPRKPRQTAARGAKNDERE